MGAEAAALGGTSLSFAYAVTKDLWVYMKHKRRRAKDLMSKYRTLKIEIKQLCGRWADMNARINNQSSSVQRGQEHEGHKEKVKMVTDRFEIIKRNYEKLSEGFEDQDFTEIGEKKIWTRKFFKLAKLHKDVVILIGVASAVRNGLNFEALTIDKEPAIVEKLRAEELDHLDSHKDHLQNLLKYVNEEKLKRIGIYGVPGIGKTNIMRNLNNWFLPLLTSNSPHLDYVIWVTVERKPTTEEIVESIQREIMARLKITGGNNGSENKQKISEKLCQRRYLLLLDNLLPGVHLEKIGICEDHQDGKVVMTAENLKPLNDVGTIKEIEIGPLRDGESRSLLKKFIGGGEFSPEETTIVDKILDMLGDIPALIQSIGYQLGRKRGNLRYWRGVKQNLESAASTVGALKIAGFDKFYSSLYEELESNLKKCLLYATLYPKKYMIPKDNLVECWKAENLLQSSSPTLTSARNMGEYVLGELEERSLLKIPDEKCVAMPILIRKLAIEQWKLEEFPSEASCIRGHATGEKWHTARWISLIQKDVRELPLIRAGNGLSTLLLQKNPNLATIEEVFFSRILKLLVLDLHGTRIKLLPSSVSSLVSLRCLYLNGCSYLEQLPTSIVKLKKLEVLDIRNTSILGLPDHIWQLLSLRCLRISCGIEKQEREAVKLESQKLLIFPPVKRNKLSDLEELTIDFPWEVSDEFVRQVQGEMKARFQGIC